MERRQVDRLRLRRGPNPLASAGQHLLLQPSKSLSSIPTLESNSAKLYHVGHARSKAQLQHAYATQERTARLRRLERVIDDTQFRASMRVQVKDASREVKVLSHLLSPAKIAGHAWYSNNLFLMAGKTPAELETAKFDFESGMPGSALVGQSVSAADCSGFPVDACPEQLPNLKNHHCIVAHVLRGDPSIFTELSSLKTRNGVSLARCIKPGMDVLGDAVFNIAGVVAGDSECYELFSLLFDKVIRELHQYSFAASVQPRDTKFESLESFSIDPSGVYASKVWVELRRNLFNLPMPPAMSRIQRRVLEQRLSALLKEALGGTYLPLPGSKSFPDLRGGMSFEQMEELEEEDVFFPVPSSDLELASGLGRDWPDGRGIFLTEERDIFVWINQEDHIRIRAVGYHTGDLQGAFRRLCKAEEAIAQALRSESGFARTEKLGFLTAMLENLGTGLTASVTLQLPKLSAQPGFEQLCKRLNLSVEKESASGSMWILSNLEHLGSSELQQVSAVGNGVRKLIAFETRAANGEDICLNDIAL